MPPPRAALIGRRSLKRRALRDGDGFGGDEDDDDDDGAAAGKRSKRRKSGASFADASEFAEILEAGTDDYEGINPRLADWEQGKRKKRRR